MSHGDEKRAKKLTRRKLIAQGGKLGAGLAIAPFVLDLTACSSDNSSTSGKPGAPAPTKSGSTANKGKGAAGGSGSSSSKSAAAGGGAGKGSTAGNGDAIAAGSVLLGLYKGDGMNALKAAVGKLDFSWLHAGDTVLIKVAFLAAAGRSMELFAREWPRPAS